MVERLRCEAIKVGSEQDIHCDNNATMVTEDDVLVCQHCAEDFRRQDFVVESIKARFAQRRDHVQRLKALLLRYLGSQAHSIEQVRIGNAVYVAFEEIK